LSCQVTESKPTCPALTENLHRPRDTDPDGPDLLSAASGFGE
jgi:hypothetical protein